MLASLLRFVRGHDQRVVNDRRKDATVNDLSGIITCAIVVLAVILLLVLV